MFCYLRVLKNIDFDDLFNSCLHFQSSSFDHKKEFIHLLINTYLNLKAKNLGKKVTEEERGNLVRFKNKRAYIEAGQ